MRDAGFVFRTAKIWILDFNEKTERSDSFRLKD
jgi:hypothetical protein